MKKRADNLFDLIPTVGQRIATEKEGELSVVAFPRFRSRWMQRFIPRNKSATIRVRLEEHGTAVWDLIDGRRSVREIADALADHFHHEPDYEYRITTYLQQLYRQGFILFQ
jgi:hypothetical protein